MKPFKLKKDLPKLTYSAKRILLLCSVVFIIVVCAAVAALIAHTTGKKIKEDYTNTAYNRSMDNTSDTAYESGPGALALTICTINEEGTGLYVSMDCSEDNKIGELEPETKVLLIKQWELTSLISTEEGISGFVRTEVLNQVERIANPSGNALFTNGYPIPVYTVWTESGLAMYKDSGRNTEPIMTLSQGDIVYGLGYQGKTRLVYYPMQDRLGYVDTDSLNPISTPLLSSLSLVGCSNLMTYDEMLQYIDKLKSETEYSELLRVGSLGTTTLGNDIPYLVIGKKSAAYKLLLTAGMEGNETMYSNLLLKQAELILKYYSTGSCNGRAWSSIFEQVAVYIVPMVNPDGAVINEKGISAVSDETLQKQLTEINFGSSDFTAWKSNAHGVAIDNNFSVSFDSVLAKQSNSETDSTELKQYRLFNYGGEVAGSELESRSLATLVTGAGIDAVINITDFGNNIEWYCGDSEINEENFLFAEALSSITGYATADEEAEEADGSFFAWCSKVASVPAVNLNIGSITPSSPLEQFRILWQRTSNLIPETAAWLITNSGTEEEGIDEETEETEEGEEAEEETEEE